MLMNIQIYAFVLFIFVLDYDKVYRFFKEAMLINFWLFLIEFLPPLHIYYFSLKSIHSNNFDVKYEILIAMAVMAFVIKCVSFIL